MEKSQTQMTLYPQLSMSPLESNTLAISRQSSCDSESYIQTVQPMDGLALNAPLVAGTRQLLANWG